MGCRFLFIVLMTLDKLSSLDLDTYIAIHMIDIYFHLTVKQI